MCNRRNPKIQSSHLYNAYLEYVHCIINTYIIISNKAFTQYFIKNIHNVREKGTLRSLFL